MNMESTELQRFNILLLDGKECFVSTISNRSIRVQMKNELDDLFCDISNLQPVPLTEEIVKRFDAVQRIYSFDRDRKEYYFELENDYGGEINCQYINGKFSVCVIGCDDGRVGKQLEFAHELQNAYQVLKGARLFLKDFNSAK